MENINFTAIDFETATTNRMACQVGIVVVNNGVITEKYSSLIRPPSNSYDQQTINVHHILPEHTKKCKTFDIIWCDIEKYFTNTTIVAHNATFDQDVLFKNLEYYDLPTNDIGDFICTYNIYGLGLHDLCLEFGMNNEGHHDALFDAECCAKFYINHLNGVKPENYRDIGVKVEDNSYHTRICGDVLKKDLTGANPDNPFYDKKVVITGVFTQERIELANKIKILGADIDTGITKKTNFVLIGKEPGPKKIEKLEKLLIEGYEIVKVYQSELDGILEKYL